MKVQICMGSKCTMMGANSILDAVDYIKEHGGYGRNALAHLDELDVELINCTNACKESDQLVAPVVIIDGKIIFRATAQEVSEEIINGLS